MNVKDKLFKCINKEADWFDFYGDTKEEALIMHQKHWVRESILAGMQTRIM